METKELKNKHSENSFTSAQSITEKEFKKGIDEAEKGPFDTVQESMTKFELWLKKRKNK